MELRRHHSDIEEFRAAVMPYLDELYGTAIRLTRSRSEAEDLLQEALLRAWAFWHRFEHGTNARAWMHRIVTNTFINGYRRQKREREVLDEVHREGDRLWRPAVLRQEDADDMGDEVQAALRSLPDEFRIVVLMVDRDEASYQEVSEALGCPIGTVMSRLHRGRRALKRRLREYATSEGYVQQAA